MVLIAVPSHYKLILKMKAHSVFSLHLLYRLITENSVNHRNYKVKIRNCINRNNLFMLSMTHFLFSVYSHSVPFQIMLSIISAFACIGHPSPH